MYKREINKVIPDEYMQMINQNRNEGSIITGADCVKIDVFAVAKADKRPEIPPK